MAGQPLLLISRTDMQRVSDSKNGDRLVRRLARLTRRGYHLLSLGSQPDDWSKNRAISSRSNPAPRTLRQKISEAGGHLDGVYYIPRSMLTQKKNRADALKDIMSRFGTGPASCYLMSSSKKLVKAANTQGMNAFRISDKSPLINQLTDLLKRPG